MCTGDPTFHNMGTRQGFQVQWRAVEKDIVKVCIRKRTGNLNG